MQNICLGGHLLGVRCKEKLRCGRGTVLIARGDGLDLSWVYLVTYMVFRSQVRESRCTETLSRRFESLIPLVSAATERVPSAEPWLDLCPHRLVEGEYFKSIK